MKSLYEQIISKCVHFNGVQHKTCEAGVDYNGVRDASRKFPVNFPCFAEGPDTCQHRKFRTPEQAQAEVIREIKGGDQMTKKVSKANGTSERAVIVTTEHRGVFFGYAKATDGETIKLKRARLCVYWSADVKGFMGLAAMGPSATCRIGPPADITLRKITAVLEVTPEATARWEGGPWK